MLTEKIDISIDGPTPADVTRKDGDEGVMTVVYAPITPGEYRISVKSQDKHIRGSPFSAKISGESFV